MLHFFPGIERSEEEKGDGAARVFAEIRQIDQFAPAHTHRRTDPDHPSYPGEGAARSGRHTKKPLRNVPQRPRQRAFTD